MKLTVVNSHVAEHRRNGVVADVETHSEIGKAVIEIEHMYMINIHNHNLENHVLICEGYSKQFNKT